jgi:hypothetical protein
MAKRQKMELWEEELIAQGEAIRRLRQMGAAPEGKGARVKGTKLRYKSTQVANVQNRDRAAVHKGFAPDVFNPCG